MKDHMTIRANDEEQAALNALAAEHGYTRNVNGVSIPDRSGLIRAIANRQLTINRRNTVEPITSITVELVENDLRDFLAETSDVDVACEEYRAEYESRLSAQYPEAECRVELGETNGMHTWYRINGERTDEGSSEYQNEIPVIEHIADQVGNTMEDWLTVA